MKIIAKTATGYLVEGTIDELMQCAGYRSVYSVPPDTKLGKLAREWRSVGMMPIGTTIDVTAATMWLEDLRKREDDLRQAEAVLRALADKLHAALPSTIIPPPVIETVEAL